MTAEDLKKSILHQAIQGKLVPQNPTDEPASVLLDRIRAEKARLVAEGKIKRDKSESIIYRNPDGQYIERIGKTESDITDQIPFEIPVNWEWVRLKDVSIIQEGPGIRSFQYKTEGVQLLTVTNILEGEVDLNKSKKYISQDEYEEKYLHFQLNNGDIVTACSGGSWGKSSFYTKENYNIILNTSTLRLRFYADKADNNYLYILTKTHLFKQQLADQLSGMQPNFGYAHYSKILIPLPPLKEQERIVARIEELMPMVEQYGKAQSRLDELSSSLGDNIRKSILQYAIQGKLVPQNPEEEPASTLIERIRAEKSRLVAEGKIKRDKNESIIYRNNDGQYIERIGKTETDITDQIPFEIPDSWEWVRMGQIGDWGAGATPAKAEPKYYGGDILWLRTGELNNGIVYDTEIKITDKALKECSLRLNQIGDILIAMYGATIGKLAIVGTPLTTNQACCACTPIMIYNLYLFYFLMASKPDFIKKGEGGAQPNISREKLISYLMPLPPLEEQKRIVERIEQILSLYK